MGAANKALFHLLANSRAGRDALKMARLVLSLKSY